jgi:hypothetical protein
MAKTIEAARKNRNPVDALLSSGIPNELEEKVHDALRNAGLDDPVEDLMGHCQRNAVAVRDEFRTRDLDAVVVKGWVNDLDAHVVPASMSEAEEYGVAHWWAEVRLDTSTSSTWYTVDLASNLAGEKWGDLYIFPERPADYRPAVIDPAEMDDVRDYYDLQPPEGIYDDY